MQAIKRIKMKRFLTLLFIGTILVPSASAQKISGKVMDSATNQPIVGATVVVDNTLKSAFVDADGTFAINNIAAGTYTLSVTMMSYEKFTSAPLTVKAGMTTELTVLLVEEENVLSNVVVTGRKSTGSDIGLISQIRDAKVVASGVSAQQISRTQDKDASEVVKRIPGIAIRDDKYLIVRGLPQRYNNTWINGAAVPSTESDSRAFSFDIIPSSQIENIMVVKTLAAEYPADYSGGFVMITTKAITEKNQMQITYGTGINTKTHFSDFSYNKGSGTDFLGFDNGMRSIKNAPDYVPIENGALVDQVSKTGFNNNWSINTANPLLDQKFNLSIERSYVARNNDKFGFSLATNYSYTNKTLTDIQSNQFEIYDDIYDKPIYRYKFMDEQYMTDVKLGGMLNFSYIPHSKSGSTSNKYEFRNIFNQLGRNRYTYRIGRNEHESCNEMAEEYFYQSRTIYAGLLSGKHTLSSGSDDIHWNANFAYTNCYQPDRRIAERRQDQDGEYRIFDSSVDRLFTAMNEYSISGSADYIKAFNLPNNYKMEIKTGLHAESKTRDYKTRLFRYLWTNDNTLPNDFKNLSNDELFSDANLGYPDKLFVRDYSSKIDNYDAGSNIMSAYAAANVSLNKFNIYAGVRFEHNLIQLTHYKSATKQQTNDYNYNNLFPSINVSYHINEKSLIRSAYGMSVNRQEFREISPINYYDFEIFSRIAGNPDLKQATVHNVDLRYEFYPSSGEVLSAALFYKQFKNPIEWTYMLTGGKYEYSYVNGNKADNLGIEFDIRKQLGFIGLTNFMATLNVALISSKVQFKEGSKDHDRAMQGQSPYIVNGGIFYQSNGGIFTIGLLYNTVGKRIVGLGIAGNGDGDNSKSNIPNLYELPRNLLDLSFSVKLSKMLELKGAVKDILCEDVRLEQFPEFKSPSGEVITRTQTAKRYNPGRSFSISISASF